MDIVEGVKEDMEAVTSVSVSMLAVVSMSQSRIRAEVPQWSSP